MTAPSGLQLAPRARGPRNILKYPGSAAETQPRRIQKIRHDAATEQLHIAHGGGNEKGPGYPS
jgi:hypothetical protein